MNLRSFGDFLGTDRGFWLVMGLTALTAPMAYLAPDVATYVLSVIAIIIPSIILVHDHKRDCISAERDKAMHKKLDALVGAIPEADDELQGIEPEDA